MERSFGNVIQAGGIDDPIAEQLAAILKSNTSALFLLVY